MNLKYFNMTISQIVTKIQKLETWLINNAINPDSHIITSDLKKLQSELDVKMKIVDRIALLYLSLQYCSEKTKAFSIGERICINQERFQWLNILSNPDEKPRPVSEAIESKIDNIIEQVFISNFKPLNPDPLDYEKDCTI